MITVPQAWNETFLPKPDVVVQGNALGPAAYAVPSGIQAHGTQATFDLFTRGSTTQGLRVSIARSALAGPASNGVHVQVTRVNADALSADFTAADGTFDINVQDATTMADLKGAVDGETGISSEYFGGETGTGMAERNLPISSGGANGEQATFDIFGDGEDSQGLRVTIVRNGPRRAEQTNGFRVTFVTGTADTDVSTPNKTIVITVPDGSALSLYKTTIDADSHFTSDYFGGETGTSTIAVTDNAPPTVSAGGTPDTPAVVDVQSRTGDAHLRISIVGHDDLSGTAANGTIVDLTRNNDGGSPTVAIDRTDKEITGDLRDDTRVRDLAALLNEIDGLTAESIGEGGGELAEATGVVSDGGDIDPTAWVRVVADGSIFAATGTSAPTDDTASVVVRVTNPWVGVLDPGDSLYLRRVGANNVRASVEMWRHTV